MRIDEDFIAKVEKKMIIAVIFLLAFISVRFLFFNGVLIKAGNGDLPPESVTKKNSYAANYDVNKKNGQTDEKPSIDFPMTGVSDVFVTVDNVEIIANSTSSIPNRIVILSGSNLRGSLLTTTVPTTAPTTAPTTVPTTVAPTTLVPTTVALTTVAPTTQNVTRAATVPPATFSPIPITTSTHETIVTIPHTTHETTVDPTGTHVNTAPVPTDHTMPSGSTYPTGITDPSGVTSPTEFTEPSGSTAATEHTVPSESTTSPVITDPEDTTSDTDDIASTEAGDLTDTTDPMTTADSEDAATEAGAVEFETYEGTYEPTAPDTQADDSQVYEKEKNVGRVSDSRTAQRVYKRSGSYGFILMAIGTLLTFAVVAIVVRFRSRKKPSCSRSQRNKKQ